MDAQPGGHVQGRTHPAPGAPWWRRVWWHVRRPHRAHRVRWVLFTIGLLACTGVWAVGTARTEYSFGPHVANYSVTFDSKVTVDLGPLGSVVVPDLTPAPLGVHVDVGEIPAGLGTSSLAGSISDLSSDVQTYVSFFSAPQVAVSQVAHGLAADALLRFSTTFAAIWFAIYAGYRALGVIRRRQLGLWMRGHKALPAGVACVALVLGGFVADTAIKRQSQPETLRVLAGTQFSGAYVTGRLGSVINQLATTVLTTYREDQQFYQAIADAATDVLAVDPLSNSERLHDLKVAVFVTDLHCNVGMAPVIAAVAQGAGATLVLDGGDTTISGTSVERYCVDTYTDALPQGVTWVVAPGNHDSYATADQERAAGMTVLDGKVITVDGLTIVGDADARITALGAATTLKNPDKTQAQVAQGVEDAACNANEPVDVVLFHDGREETGALRHGCAKLMLSGHLHARMDPLDIGPGVWFQGSSTGRDIHETTQLTPLRADAEMTLWYFDATTGDPVYYRLLTMHPGGTVTLTQATVP